MYNLGWLLYYSSNEGAVIYVNTLRTFILHFKFAGDQFSFN